MTFLLLVFLFIIPSTGNCDIIGPDGISKDHHGSLIFKSHLIKIYHLENSTLIELKTNFMYDKYDVEYNISDVYIKTLDGSLAIKMAPKRIKGDILKDPEWKSAKDMLCSINEFCTKIDGSPIFVHAKGGKYIGKAEIEEIIEDKTQTILINIPNRYLNGITITGIEWGTALCGNSLLLLNNPIGLTSIPHTVDSYPTHYSIPNFSHPASSVYWPLYNDKYIGWSGGGGGIWPWDDIIYDNNGGNNNNNVTPIPGSLLLFLTGIFGLFLKRK